MIENLWTEQAIESSLAAFQSAELAGQSLKPPAQAGDPRREAELQPRPPWLPGPSPASSSENIQVFTKLTNVGGEGQSGHGKEEIF